MSSVNISSMYMANDRVITKHNQAELSKLEVRTTNMFNTRAPGEVTGTTRLKVRVENPAASRLDESSGKALSTKHAYRAEMKDLDSLNALPFQDSGREPRG